MVLSMTLETTEVSKPKIKKKSTWMSLFVINPPLDDLAKAQLESRSKILNDLKKIKRR
jgi:hypothetical protein